MKTQRSCLTFLIKCLFTIPVAVSWTVMVERLLWGYWGGGRTTLSGAIGVGSIAAEDEVAVITGAVVFPDAATFSTPDTTSEPLGRPLFSRAWRKMSSDVAISSTWQNIQNTIFHMLSINNAQQISMHYTTNMTHRADLICDVFLHCWYWQYCPAWFPLEWEVPENIEQTIQYYLNSYR